ncbi:hypothetical protein AB0M97_25285 [Streptomyces sp. NPDC051207]|uniref:hypothetical protein n=1 Tax=Streptomyces sp. NPDC051207 TaxID=3154641 RepID=UPI00343ED8B1
MVEKRTYDGTGEGPRRDSDIESVFETIEQLHERVAELRPDLIFNITFGHRLKAPERPGKEPTPDEARFHDYFALSQSFDNVFAKAGDGFIDVHSLPV